jgi:hypothetical protein
MAIEEHSKKFQNFQNLKEKIGQQKVLDLKVRSSQSMDS